MSERENNFLRIGAVSGIVAPLLAFACILIAIYSYPPFSWTENALSDLGIVPGITGPLFNFGLYASGLFIVSFAVFGLFTYFRSSWVGKIGSASLAATGLSLMGIGFFPENVIPAHYFFSVAFFVLLPISLLIIAGAFAFKHEMRMAFFTLLIAVVAALPWVLYYYVHYVSGVAIPEAASALDGSVWIVLLSCKMLRTASQPNS